MIFIPLYVRQTFEGTKLLTIASVVAVPMFTKFAASNFWGALADYTKKLKPFIIIGLAGYAGCLAALCGCGSAASVVITAAAASLFYAAVSPISQSYVTLLRESEKGRAVGDLLVFQSLGWFVGGIACAYLFEPEFGIPVRKVLLGSSALSAGVLVTVAVMLKPLYLKGTGKEGWERAECSEPEGGDGGEEGSESVEYQGGARHSLLFRLLSDLRVLYQSKSLAATFVLVGISTAGVWMFFGNFSVYMTEYVKGSTGAVGWVMSLSALVGMLTFRPAGKFVDSFGPVKVLLVSVLTYLLVYSLMSATVNPILVSILLCVPVYPPFNVSAIALVSDLSGESRRAGGLGILSGIFAVSPAVGSLLGGAVGDISGLGALPRWAVGTEILAVVVAIVSVTLLKTLPLNDGRRSPAGRR
jgi:MFS family permease